MKNIFGIICIIIIFILNFKHIFSTEIILIDFLENIYFCKSNIKKANKYNKIINICEKHKFIKKRKNTYILTKKGENYYFNNKNTNFYNIITNLTLWFIALGNFFF